MFLRSNLLDDVNCRDTAVWYGDVVAAVVDIVVVVAIVVAAVVAIVVVVPIVVVVVVPIVVVVVVAIVVVVPIVVVVVVPIVVVVECSRTHRLAKDVHVEAGHRKAAAIEVVKCVWTYEQAGRDCHSLYDTEEPKSMEEVLVVQMEAQIQPGSPTKYGNQQEL